MTGPDTSEGPDDAVLRSVAQAFEDAMNQHDARRVAEVFTEDAVMEDPSAPEGAYRGRAAIRAYFEAWMHAFPDVEMRQEVLFKALDGREYASRWRVGGTMERELRPPGFAPTHRRVENVGVAVIELEGTLISRCRQFYDATDVARQLGAAPPRGSALERAGVFGQRLVVAARARRRGA
jgi:steroid delta-isomerase-like uncharacterized protein